MASRFSLVALGIGVYLAVVVASFPASLAHRWFSPDSIRLAAVDGTIWQGGAAYGAVGGVSFSDLRWRLEALALLTGKIRLGAEARLSEGFVNAEVTASGNEVRLSELRLSTNLAVFRDVLREAMSVNEIGGVVNLSLESLVLVDGWPVSAAGSLEIVELTAPPLIPVEGVTSIPLGNYRVQFTPTAEPGIAASINDTGGPLELAGRLSLLPDRSYVLDSLVKPRAGAHEVLVQGLEIWSPDATADGRRKFVERGTL